MCEIRARLAENGLQLRNTFPTVEFMAFGPEPAPISWCWWQTQCLDDWGALPFRICHPSAVSLIHKEIRTRTSPVPKPCIGYPTIPFENFSTLDSWSIESFGNGSIQRALSIFDNAIHWGSDSWMALSQIYKAERNPPARGSTKNSQTLQAMPMYPTGPKQKLD